MTSVTIIGTDGAGKTTVGKKLASISPVPAKYIYMGANIESSNVALPTSRLVLLLKRRRYRRKATKKGISDSSYLSTHHEAHRSVKYGPILAWVRNLNRLAEAVYRHAVSWSYQKRGFLVINDRSLLFDSTPESTGRTFADRVYRSTLKRWYPEPDLVIFLDAPPAVLLARKGEGDIEYLAERRAAYFQQGEAYRNFVVVDATQSLEAVLEDVGDHIASLNAVPDSAKRRSALRD